MLPRAQPDSFRSSSLSTSRMAVSVTLILKEELKIFLVTHPIVIVYLYLNCVIEIIVRRLSLFKWQIFGPGSP
jgi:uncharacterized membrane protein